MKYIIYVKVVGSLMYAMIYTQLIFVILWDLLVDVYQIQDLFIGKQLKKFFIILKK
jgi:hypothetical protein